ncbi:MAG: hypothetical protein RLZZ366_1729, partial [Pseudomonadota bacterium]
FSNIFGRVLMGAVALIGVGQPGSATAAPGWTASDDDALLFDVRLGQYRLGDGVRGYQTPGGTCLDLADTIMALDISLRLDKKLRRATGWAFEEGHTITIDREANTVQIMNKTQKLVSEDIYDTPEGWCVTTGKLASWLGIDLQADQANALLVIKSTSKLPVELQMERRSRAAKVQNVANFDLSTLPQAHMPFKGIRAPSVDAVVSIGGLKRVGGGSNDFSARYELYAAGEVGPIAYNARLSSTNHAIPNNLRLQAYRTDPEAKLLGPLHATHAAAGDVAGASTALVTQGSSGRGIIVTNRPIDRPANFDRTDFRGELPNGWDAELYRNGQLLAFAVDRSDGRYEFLDVPLQYGQNRFEVVLYGPQGQIRRENRAVPVGLDSIPPRKTYYWAGVYQQGQDLIGLTRTRNPGDGGWRGGIGFERGLNVKTSVAAYAHSLVLDDRIRRNYLEAAIRRAVGPTLVEVGASFTTNGGIAARAQMLGELAKTNFSIESIVASGGYRSDRVTKGVTGIHQLMLDHSFNLGRTLLPIHVESRYTTLSDGTGRWDSGVRTSTTIGRMSFTGGIDVRKEHIPVGPSPPAQIEAAFLANAYIGHVRLRGESRFRLSPVSRFESATLIGEWSAGKDDRYRNDWRAEIGYDAEQSRARVGFGYVRRFKKLALTASIEGASDGSAAAGLSLAFSLGPDPSGHGGIRMTSHHLATEGQADVRVFRDLNADGHYQAGEPLEKDVQLAAGRNPVDDLTGKDGHVIIDSLEPYQPVLIGIDASSLPDPLVQPATTGVVVTPRPGVAAIIDLPLVSAGEVDGTLTRAGGGTIEGVDLELVDVEGHVRAKTRSEYDGFFLFEGVPYGRYTIRIAQLSADAAKLRPTLSASVLVAGETPSVHLGTVVPEARAMQAAN